MNNQQRINWIDWSKVFAIYLVVLGHLVQRTGIELYIFYFIYLFHMPFFFFISGYLFKVREGQVPKRSAIKECPSPRDADVLEA